MTATRTPLSLLFLLCASGIASAECVKIANVPVTVEVAKTASEHARGLMFRKSLPENTGMWFVFSGPHHAAFWMKDTVVALDIVFVGRDRRVVHIHENARPLDETPLASPVPYWHVLEVPAGFARTHRLLIGDRVGQVKAKCS